MIKEQQLIDILKNLEIPEELISDLVTYFFHITDDLKTRDLEKSSSGKFVETLVQVFQSLNPKRTGYDPSPQNIDNELNNVYNSTPIKNIEDGSRIPIIRLARAIYSLRSKRGIIHRNNINPNIYDLEIIHCCAQWIMTELVRIATKASTEEVREIIREIQQPPIPIEEFLHTELVSFLIENNLDTITLHKLIDFDSGKILLKRLGKTNAEIQRNLAVIIAIKNCALTGEFLIPKLELLDAAKTYGSYDPRNFSKYMKMTKMNGRIVFLETDDKQSWKIPPIQEIFIAETIKRLAII